jgi:type II secretory ATPase GspE/PulE/Tfp pilus assembly ATPase PilB-like protein
VKEHGLGLDVRQCWIPVGCDECHKTGYLGRSLIADYGTVDHLAGEEALWASTKRLIEVGTTSPAEAIRILGLPKDEPA